MRRLENSPFARFTSKVVAAAMLLNLIGLPFAATPARAQLTGSAPQWAVIDFANKSGLGGAELGGSASDAFATLLSGTNRATIVGKESVERGVKELEFTQPLTRDLDYLRLGQWLQVETIFVGEVQKARINKGGNGKSADVVLVVRGIDVASNLPVMGTAVPGQSSERSGDVSDATLLNEAVNYAAQKAVSNILSQQVAPAFVLGTPGKFVKINKGARDGLKVGMELVVTRGREEVGIIKVNELDPDTGDCNVVRSSKGVAPGDKCRVIYRDLPTVDLTRSGPKVRTTRKVDVGSALIGLLVVGAIATLVAKEGGNTSPGDLVAEATLDTAFNPKLPAVRLRWKPNMFAPGPSDRVEWHIWRDGYADTPVEVIAGGTAQGLDNTLGRTRNWRIIEQIGGITCTEDPGAEAFAAPAPGVTPGISYQYRIELIYKQVSSTLPNGGGDPVDCFFKTGLQAATGLATPLNQVTLIEPANLVEDIGDSVLFSWTAVPGANKYVVEISTSSNFATANSIRVPAGGRIETLQTPTVSTDGPINISNIFSGTQTLYWRVGAANSGDFPGPVPDAAGERYVFSQPFQFKRVVLPPPPPSN